MKYETVAAILGANAPAGLAGLEPRAYSIDSRTVSRGDLFFAIRGERHDGHRFVAEVLNKGALAAVVSRDFPSGFDSGVGAADPRLIRVDDTLRALQDLASAVLRDWAGQEIAITGSMGKTTTKDMTAAALAGAGQVFKTAGNLNNDFGLPLSVLRMESGGARAADFDFAVLEMGMNHAGEIARLAGIAPPHCGVVTVVAPVHLEFFESIEAIAAAKAELVAGIRPGGLAVLNADDPLVARMRTIRADIEYRMFGTAPGAEVMARDIEPAGLRGSRFRLVTRRGDVEVRLPVGGVHNIYNALAAAAVADRYEAPLDGIAAALAGAGPPKMRGEILRLGNGVTVIDDSYNSNPRALLEMVKTIATEPDCRRRIVVAGEMLELGDRAATLHRETGHHFASLGVDLLIGVRGFAANLVEGAREGGMTAASAVFAETPDDAAEVLEKQLRPGDLVLVKGSRGVKTESVVERLKKAFGTGRE